MADTIQFDLVSPERKLASLQATSVQIPAMEGDFTAMPNHAPFLTTLRPGIVRVQAGAETTEYVVTGGFAEISPTAASILAEQAVLRAEAGVALLEELMGEAERELAAALPERRLAAGQRIRDVIVLRSRLSV